MPYVLMVNSLTMQISVFVVFVTFSGRIDCQTEARP